MALYSYKKQAYGLRRVVINFVSYSSLIVGSFFLFWSFYPVISFEIYSRIFLQGKALNPAGNIALSPSLNAANSVLGAYNIFSTNLSDYTRAGAWFPSLSQSNIENISLTEYELAVPKLNIKKARVLVGGEDLTKGLVHYLPRSRPGEIGNVAIFGHSTLPTLSHPGDYKSIFTYLPSLDRGDEIYVTVNNVTYKYEVYDMFVIRPDEVSILDPQFDDSYLTLITCVPPGTALKRLVVKAKLSKI